MAWTMAKERVDIPVKNLEPVFKKMPIMDLVFSTALYDNKTLTVNWTLSGCTSTDVSILLALFFFTDEYGQMIWQKIKRNMALLTQGEEKWAKFNEAVTLSNMHRFLENVALRERNEKEEMERYEKYQME